MEGGRCVDEGGNSCQEVPVKLASWHAEGFVAESDWVRIVHKFLGRCLMDMGLVANC